MGIGELKLGLFVFVALISVLRTSGAFTPQDNYLIACGSSANTTIGTRTFIADAFISSTLTAAGSISANTSSNLVSSFDSSSLYKTARIFTGLSSYSFSIQKHGRHFIRLYLFPFVFQSYNLTAASFNVSTDDVVLLHNFQPQGNSSPVFKEYLVNINRDKLILSFAPSGNPALAFINAIEVVSVPDNLINDTAQTVNPLGLYQGLSGQDLETVYHVNMGGPKVSSENDTLWRTWVNDQSFLVSKNLTKVVSYSGKINYLQGGATRETAPDIVYSTATELAESSNTSNAMFNMTWLFNVDADYSSYYFIRLHFCDIVSKALNNLYFDVYINDWSAARNLDLSQDTQSLAAPYFTDFVLKAGDASGKLRISIGPSSLFSVSPDGILNGLEIMKMNIATGSGPVNAPSGSKKNFAVIWGPVLGAIAVVIVAFVLLVVRRRRKMARKQQSKTWMPFSINGLTSHSTGSRTSNGSAATSGLNASLGYRFPLVVLQEATNNFDENWVLGVGGFGKVYKGVLRDETKVAVKRGNPKSQQGLNEFRTEIELLSRLRHRHLVSLIGYCDEWNEMILVYEYMEKGTLKSHLYGSDLPSPSWKQRLEICIGSARGLHYLHTGFAKAIIHRDVKSANILLDGNLLAKVADFGLSKTGPDLDQTHVSTAVKGSFGYLDPEYFRRQQLTEKSDVYSFGVVLLEVLCARPVIDPTLPREMVNLAEWAMKWQKRGELEQIVDPRIAGTIRPDSLRKFGETVEKCLADYGVERPAMGDVLWNLEYVLQLQEADLDTSEFNSIIRIAELPSQVQNIMNHDGAAVGGVSTSRSNDLYDVTMSNFFSQPETNKTLFSPYEMAWKQQSMISMCFSFNGLTEHSRGSRIASVGYRFPLVVLQDATNNFDKNWLIGVGGFGKVYKGVLKDGTKVAVKRGEPTSRQSVHEFFTEIERLSRLRHRHLVSLAGYCDEWNEMILVYEYMEKGMLRSHLYGSKLPSLSWKQRLEICIGSARGLHYIHTGIAKAIIHCDVKSSNILLDGKLTAKIADFGIRLDQTRTRIMLEPE